MTELSVEQLAAEFEDIVELARAHKGGICPLPLETAQEMSERLHAAARHLAKRERAAQYAISKWEAACEQAEGRAASRFVQTLSPSMRVVEAGEIERCIRIAIWNTACWQGMPQEVAQSFIRHAMEEPTMVKALASIGDEGDAGWQDMASAPRDGRYILAVVAPGRGRYLELHAGRVFSIRHEGKTQSGYDLGWAVYPGFGGSSDHDFTAWMPTPTPPQSVSGGGE